MRKRRLMTADPRHESKVVPVYAVEAYVIVEGGIGPLIHNLVSTLR